MFTCRVVGDLMKSAGHRMGSVKELDTYIRDPRAISGHVQVPTVRTRQILVTIVVQQSHSCIVAQYQVSMDFAMAWHLASLWVLLSDSLKAGALSSR